MIDCVTLVVFLVINFNNNFAEAWEKMHTVFQWIATESWRHSGAGLSMPSMRERGLSMNALWICGEQA